MFVPFMHVATIENANMIVTRQNRKINGAFDFHTSFNFLFTSFKKWLKIFLIFSRAFFRIESGEKERGKYDKQ